MLTHGASSKHELARQASALRVQMWKSSCLYVISFVSDWKPAALVFYRMAFGQLVSLMFQFVVIDSCPDTRHHWKEPSSFFTPSFQVFIHSDELPSEPSPGSAVPALCSQEGCSSPFSILVALCWTHSVQYVRVSCSEEPKTAHCTPAVAPAALRSGGG